MPDTPLNNQISQEALLAAIIDGSDDAIISKDLSGKILSWNHGAEVIYGYSAQEAVGQPIHLVVPPNKVKELADVMEKVGRGEHIHHFETVRIAKSGRRLDVSLTISPIYSNNQIIGISTIARDITAQKEKQVELAQLNQLMLGRELKMIELKAEIERLKRHATQ